MAIIGTNAIYSIPKKGFAEIIKTALRYVKIVLAKTLNRNP